MRTPQLKRGGLASWQVRRALGLLEAHLDGNISPVQLAQECGLSPSHFARAFRISTGLAPHQWLLHHRVEKAKAALRDSEASLSVIALACGFADQSHFTRVFSRCAGISPAAWRRAMRS
jgi:AraC-like DNA-binding protein